MELNKNLASSVTGRWHMPIAVLKGAWLTYTHTHAYVYTLVQRPGQYTSQTLEPLFFHLKRKVICYQLEFGK